MIWIKQGADISEKEEHGSSCLGRKRQRPSEMNLIASVFLKISGFVLFGEVKEE